MKHFSSLLLLASLAFTALPSVAQPPPPTPAPPAVALITGDSYRDSIHASGPIFISQSRAFKASQYVYLYRPLELTAAGLTTGRFIDTIGFYHAGPNSLAYGPWVHTLKIWITEQTDPDITTGTRLSVQTAGLPLLSTVVDPKVPVPGIMKLPIDVPYQWQGSNLRIMIDYEVAGGSGNTHATGPMNFRRWNVPNAIMGDGGTPPMNTVLSTTTAIVTIANTRPETYLYHTSVVNSRTKLARQFRMYPTPATNVLNISNNVGAELQTATLTDLSGRQVLTQPVSGLTAQLDLSQVTPGMYHLHLTTSRGPAILTVVKQ